MLQMYYKEDYRAIGHDFYFFKLFEGLTFIFYRINFAQPRYSKVTLRASSQASHAEHSKMEASS